MKSEIQGVSGVLREHDMCRILRIEQFGQRVARVLDQTSSGGVCVNATVMHVAVPDLPFGGVGASGMGAYHGKAGFDVFSHRKSVLAKPTRLDPKLAYPPYTKLKERLIRRFL